MLFKNITWRGFGIDACLNQLASEKLAKIEKQLWEYLNENPALAPVSHVFNMHDFQTAIQHSASNKNGKTLLRII